MTKLQLQNILNYFAEIEIKNINFDFNEYFTYDTLLEIIERIETLSINGNKDKRFHFDMDSLSCSLYFDEKDLEISTLICECRTGDESNINKFMSRKEALTRLIKSFAKWAKNKNKNELL